MDIECSWMKRFFGFGKSSFFQVYPVQPIRWPNSSFLYLALSSGQVSCQSMSIIITSTGML